MLEMIQSSLPKMPPRRENRIVVVQFMYMWDVNPPEDFLSTLKEFLKSSTHSRDFYSFAEQLLDGILAKLPEIDQIIQDNVKNWTFERIARVDLAILRMAIYELLYRKDIPPIVTINEAIDISKFLSQQDSKRFINGVLDKLKATLDRPARESAH